jgi:hypothetical protein
VRRKRRRILRFRLYRDAQNLARGRQYDEALLKYRQILQVDPNHQLGGDADPRGGGLPARRALRRPGRRNPDEVHHAEGRGGAAGGVEHDRYAARSAQRGWVMIRALDPQKFEDEADSKINVINNRLATLEQERAAVEQARERKTNALVYGAVAFVIGLVFVVGALSIVYVRRQRQQILSEIRSITQSSVRPPRQLEGAGTRVRSAVRFRWAASAETWATAGCSVKNPRAQPGDPLADTMPPPPPPPQARQAPPQQPAAPPPPPPPPPQPVAAAPPPPAPAAPEPPREPVRPPTADPGPVTMAMGMNERDREEMPETVESPMDIDELFAVTEEEAPAEQPEPPPQPARAAAPPPAAKPQPGRKRRHRPLSTISFPTCRRWKRRGRPSRRKAVACGECVGF